MVPPRCPECGRFLSKAFAQGLLAEPAPCPRCETVLDGERFRDADADALEQSEAPEPTEPSEPSDAAESVEPSEPSGESVRPPDLPPAEVRPGSDRDPLEGWDEVGARTGGVQLKLVEDRIRDLDAAPVGAALAIVGGGVLGGLLGGLTARQHRSVGAVIGTLAGASAVVLGARALGIPLDDEV